MVKRSVVACLLASPLHGCGFFDPRPAPLARTCAEWSRPDADERLQTAEAFIEPGLLLSWAAPSTWTASFAGGPGTRLTEIVTNVYR